MDIVINIYSIIKELIKGTIDQLIPWLEIYHVLPPQDHLLHISNPSIIKYTKIHDAKTLFVKSLFFYFIMQTVHGAHHRGLVRNEDYKRVWNGETSSWV